MQLTYSHYFIFIIHTFDESPDFLQVDNATCDTETRHLVSSFGEAESVE